MALRKHMIRMIAMGAAFSGASAMADVTVTGDGGAWIDPSNYDISWDQDGWATVNIISRYSSGNSVFEVHGSKDASQGIKIAGVGISVATDNDLGTTIVVRVLEDEPGGIEEVGFIYRFGSEITLLNRVSVTGPLGYVDVDSIGIIEVQGDIVGPLVANGDDSTPWINQVTSFNGNIYANMVVADRSDATGEYIGPIKATNGTIGAGPNDRVILHSAGHIAKLEAKSIYADITSTGSGVEGRLYGLKATDGPFVGSIHVLNLQNYPTANPSEYSCVGTMDAEITATAGNLGEPLIITGGDYPTNRSFSVISLSDHRGSIQITEDTQTGEGGRLFGNLRFSGAVGPNHNIELENGLCGLVRIDKSLIGNIVVDGTPGQADEGITGQVIINAENSTNSWTGAVSVDGTPLAPIPYYDNPSSEVGGGAVGLVPYYLHYQGCNPPGAKIDEDTNTGFEQWDPYTDCGHVHVVKKVSPGNYYPGVTLSHYGPIEQVGTGIPVTVKRATIGGMCNWDAVGNDITSQCSYTMHPGNEREIRITGPFAAGYDYLIEPKDDSYADYLVCGDVTTQDDVPIHPYAYLIRIAVPQDITINGLLQPDDISAWLAAPEDTTLDGVTDSADLVDVTEAVANSDDW